MPQQLGVLAFADGIALVVGRFQANANATPTVLKKSFSANDKFFPGLNEAVPCYRFGERGKSEI
jgi:hypothetical protein